jgi:hypothetical protein
MAAQQSKFNSTGISKALGAAANKSGFIGKIKVHFCKILPKAI